MRHKTFYIYILFDDVLIILIIESKFNFFQQISREYKNILYHERKNNACRVKK